MTEATAAAVLWNLISARVQHYRRRKPTASVNVLVGNVVRSLVPVGDPATDQLLLFTRAVVIGFGYDELQTPQGMKRYRAALRFARNTSRIQLLALPKAEQDAGT